MSNRARWAAAVMLVLSAMLLAEPGVVITKDGTSYDGDVIEDEDHVTVTIHGIATVIPRSDVVSIRYKAEYEGEFRERLAALPERDVKGRIALAREAFDQRRYDLARDALQDALRIDANSREATDLLELVDRQVRLERAGAAPAPVGAPRPPAPRAPTTDRKLLSADDINLIRQLELKPTDTAVRITSQGDVKRRFAEANNITFAEFNRLPPVQQALQIIDRGDEQMRQQVRIVSDPSSLAEYKRVVQPVVLSHCATSGCHGGAAGGRFILYTPADSDAVSYTNFYILTQTEQRTEGPGTGVFGSTMRKLIERGHGEHSLLVNYALPTNIADYDHPNVGGKPINPIFRSKQDQRYQQVVAWMDKTLARVAPDYGIDFPLPGAAATLPATAPTTEPAR